MKTVLLALLTTACLAPVTSLANPEDTGDGKRLEHMIERLDRELDLSDGQRREVEAVFTEQRARFQALRRETRAKLDAILSDAQQARLTELKTERRARMEKRRELWRERRGND